jgi:hypothetical protein
MWSRWVCLLALVLWQGLKHLERLWVLVCAHFEPVLQGVHPSILQFLMRKTLESADRRSRCRRSAQNKREKGEQGGGGLLHGGQVWNFRRDCNVVENCDFVGNASATGSEAPPAWYRVR